jgi:mannose-1-phosphate guanylyltransferase/mannose-6-phosphate isomerase
MTLNRLESFENPYVITVSSMKQPTERSCENTRLSHENIIYEPFGRNTAPAIALLCKVLKQRGLKDEIVGVFPADHYIANKEQFVDQVSLAEKAASGKKIVTFGIRPSYPATGYGYIQAEGNNGDTLHVKEFKEKPNKEVASSYIKSGDYYWNSGMFVFQVSFMVEQFKTHLPELWSSIDDLLEDHSNLNQIYKNLESVSIDYGIMETSNDVLCIPCDFGWNDVGSWEEMAKFENVNHESQLKNYAEIYEKDSSRNFVYSNVEKKIALINVHNLVIVDALEGLLITSKGRSEEVKNVLTGPLKKVLSNQDNESLRPWGHYEILDSKENSKVKRIFVKPGESISYQSHEKRAENWIIISGTPTVVINDKEYLLKAGDSIQIPVRAKHRMKNLGMDEVEFVEVQTGSYFGEDDITRYEDKYGR